MGRNSVRRSQSVVPFGVGSIVEFRSEALMPAGLEAWPPNEPEKIRDDRLARRLGVDHFRVPPPKPDKNGTPGTMAPLPFVRFPLWHFCPLCRWLKKANLYDQHRPRCDNPNVSPRRENKPPCGSLEERRRPRMLPLRFVAVCEAGHIEDFPWNAWAHLKKGEELDRNGGCKPETLYFYPTQLGGLAGLMVKCSTCDAKRSLMGATSKGGLDGLTCVGSRPWLGVDGHARCTGLHGTAPADLVALQRGASNLYFPHVDSSILIPPFSARVQQVLDMPLVRELIDSVRVNDRIPDETLHAIGKLHRLDPLQLREALERDAAIDDDNPNDETVFRFAEHQALLQERRDQGDLLVNRPQRIDAYGSIVRDWFEHVSLVERLTETRALTGFSRIEPRGAEAPAALSLGPVGWRPAFRVHGEGVFLGLRPDRLAAFAANFSDPRLDAALGRAALRPTTRLPLTVELVLLHTLAHALIKRLSFEAGYGASSIRERLYSAPDGHAHRMCGILLYTAAGDADGTLGGLVGLGRPGALERTLAAALDEARWCASDPVCAESPGQGPGSVNVAACHACALLPETSCELQNRLLDRRPVIAFFAGGVLANRP